MASGEAFTIATPQICCWKIDHRACDRDFFFGHIWTVWSQKIWTLSHVREPRLTHWAYVAEKSASTFVLFWRECSVPQPIIQITANWDSIWLAKSSPHMKTREDILPVVLAGIVRLSYLMDKVSQVTFWMNTCHVLLSHRPDFTMHVFMRFQVLGFCYLRSPARCVLEHKCWLHRILLGICSCITSYKCPDLTAVPLSFWDLCFLSCLYGQNSIILCSHALLVSSVRSDYIKCLPAFAKLLSRLDWFYLLSPHPCSVEHPAACLQASLFRKFYTSSQCVISSTANVAT